ncbi:MAG TPA: substrate-binding domain-containing protein [Armatimonadota bacterium]|jgi:ribose transport system substrate-binding protein
MVNKTVMLSAFGVALLAGCTPKTAPGNGAPAAPAGKTFVIGYSQSTLQDPWRKAMNSELEAEEKLHSNVTVNKQDAQNVASTQINQVETLDTQGIDALMISPKESGPLTPEVSKIFKKGIPVILLDRGIDGPNYTTLVGADNTLIGKQAGEYVKSKFPNGARIVEIAGIPDATATRERAKGFRDGLGDLKKYPIVASQPADYKRGPAIDVMNTIVTGNDNIQVVYAHNDEMALGAVKVLKDRGLLKSIAVIGVDGQNEAIDAVAKGDMAATFVYPRPGAEGLKAAIAVLEGKKVEKRITLPTIQITKENAAQYQGKGF